MSSPPSPYDDDDGTSALVATLTAMREQDEAAAGADEDGLAPSSSTHATSSRELLSSSKLSALTASRSLPSRAALLRSIASLAPSWHPFTMTASERQAWYRIGDECFAGVCHTSKDWLLVGRKYEGQHRYEEAAQAFCRAIRLNPHCASYYFRLGCVQCEIAEWSGAIESFHVALTLAPETSRATLFFNLGFAYSEQRAWGEATDVLRQALALKPRKHIYHNLLAVCYRHAGEMDRAVQHYKMAIALDRIQPAYRRNLAYTYMQLKQWGAAVRAWSGAIAIAPPSMHAELYRNRAFAQAERGHLACAVEDMDEALRRYTSQQQRRRCQEKLERWSARLQGTEQAYIRQQAALGIVGDYDEGSGSSSAASARLQIDGDDSLASQRQRRRQMQQMAGLIQGEWEEWHGEDYDEPSEGEEGGEAEQQPRAARREGMMRGGRWIVAPPRRRGGRPRPMSKLELEKQTRLAPALLQSALALDPDAKSSSASTSFSSSFAPRVTSGKAGTLASSEFAAVAGATTPAQFSSPAQPLNFDSSSAHMRRMIRELELDVPFAEKIEEEQMEERRRRREGREQRRDDRRRRREERRRQQQQQISSGQHSQRSDTECKDQSASLHPLQLTQEWSDVSVTSSSSESATDLDEGASDPDHDGSSSHHHPTAAPSTPTMTKQQALYQPSALPPLSSPVARARYMLTVLATPSPSPPPSAREALSARVGRSRRHRTNPSAEDAAAASVSTQMSSGGVAVPAPPAGAGVDSGGVGASSSRSLAMDESLYADDALDPYASLSRLFILLRIDPKYLWRFEEAGIHLGNMHERAPSAEALRHVLPPLGPRLTLINFMRERVEMMRARAGLPSMTQVQSASASAAAAVAAAAEANRVLSARSDIEVREAQTLAIAARIQHGTPKPPGLPRSGSGGRAGATATVVPSPHPPFSPSPPPPSSSSMSPLPSASPFLSLPLPLNPINDAPLIPASPHNGVYVARPLSARDRRVLYDARTHMRSALSPIRTIGSATWR